MTATEAAAGTTELRVIMIRSCGHEADVTTRTVRLLPEVGEETSCRSACDRIPAWRGTTDPYLRRVARYEFRTA